MIPRRPDAPRAMGRIRATGGWWMIGGGSVPICCRQGADILVLELNVAENSVEEALQARSWNRILCQACQHGITDASQRIKMGGQHLHTFCNPMGLLFEIGCFRQAPGCLGIGAMSGQFTWFPGWWWGIVLCGGCQNHLGWSYHKDQEESFYGLILNRLLEEEGMARG